MLNQIRKSLQSREQAGRMLAEKLYVYKCSRSIVMAVPQGGVPVGFHLAKTLHLPFEIIFSKRIRHPAHSDISIGAVCMDEVVLQDSTQFIPQNYVSHQINLLKHQLQEDYHRYYGNEGTKNLSGKTVIIVDDVLRETDELEACIRTVLKQEPEQIIIAAAVVSGRAVYSLAESGHRVHYLFMDFLAHSKPDTYFPKLSEEETHAMLEAGSQEIFAY